MTTLLRTTGLAAKHGFVTLLLGYVLVLTLLGDLHFALLIYVSAVVVLYTIHARTRYFLFLAMPFLVQNLLFDALRFVPFAWLPRVRVTEPYQIDLFWFGVPFEGGRILLSTWLLRFASPALDLAAGVLYHVQDGFLFLLIAILWRFGSRDLAKRFGLSFLLVNLFAFATYLLYPAAAPWYVAQYGFATPGGPIPGSAAGLSGFDRALGIDWSAKIYELNPVPFGAIPSMHAGYAFLALLFAFRVSRRFGLWMVPYFLAMLVSALYLQHHYAIDLVVGVVYALLGVILIDAFYRPAERWFFAPFRLLLLRDAPSLPEIGSPTVAPEEWGSVRSGGAP